MLTLVISLGIAAVLAANYLFGRLSAHVFVDHAIGRRAAVIWALTLGIGLIELTFVNATGFGLLLALLELPAFLALPVAWKLAVWMIGFLGAAFACVRGFQRAVAIRIPRNDAG